MAGAIPGDSHYLLLTALVTIAWQLSFFAVAATFKFDKVTDFAGGTNFVFIALLTYFLHGTYNTRQSLLTWAVVIWGLRLSGYLFYRIIKIKEDKRFDETRDNCLKFLGFWVFQMMWVWLVSLPVTFVNGSASNPLLAASDYAGIIMFVVGLITEAVADQQKFAYKDNPTTKHHWCDVGVWRYSRHPNYFGELLLWWGVFTLASSVFGSKGNQWGYFSILGPLFVCFILFGLSGMPILEANANKRYGAQEEYRQYLQRTSILIPLPTGLYGALPLSIKRWLLFEWEVYQAGLTKQGNDLEQNG